MLIAASSSKTKPRLTFKQLALLVLGSITVLAASGYGSYWWRRSMYPMGILLLVLFTESLDVRFAVRMEEVLAALLPRRLEFGRCDVPVWPAFLGNGTKVLAVGRPKYQ